VFLRVFVSRWLELPNEARCVASRLERVRQSYFGERQSDLGLEILPADRVKFVTEASLVAPRQQPCARGAANGCGDVPIREPDPVTRDRINMGSRDLAVSLTAELAVP
jgi:hypothetical protein